MSKRKRRDLRLVLDQIRGSFKDMTPSFRAIATYVVDHHHELAFASAARIGKLTGSSAATVVRFAESLGLSGFTELQALAREELHAEVNTVAQLERTMVRTQAGSLFETALRADIANLEAMLGQKETPAFQKALLVLTRARRIHLVGLRSTYGLVHHLGAYLAWIGRPGEILKPGIGDLPDQLLGVEPKDACVAVSLRRYTAATLQIVRAVKESGARIVAITDSELSPVAELADVVLLVPVQFPAFFESKVGVLSIMNALVLGLSVADRERTIAALKHRERSWFGQGTYVNESFRLRLLEQMEAFASGDDQPPPSRREQQRS